MNETVVIVRCQHCMHERKRWNADAGVVFIASTLKKYAEMKCEQCGETGMEIYAGFAPQEKPEYIQAVATRRWQ